MIDEDKMQFHFFDTLFFDMLSVMSIERGQSILKLGSFLDKHYVSSKRISPNSVFLFLVPTDTPFETVLVRAEPSRKKFIVYDPLQGR